MRDLNSSIPGAPNFKYKDFIKSDTAVRKGIDNTPTEEHWQNIEKLAVNILQPVRNFFGPTRVTSGYRSVALCEAIGSNKHSNHAKGQASDIEPIHSPIDMYTVLRWIHDNCEYRELIAEYFPDGWIHVAYREGGNTKTLKLKDKDHNFKIVTIDYIESIYG